ncbi:MAG: four helix bundle protein [Halobacteriovoraceae bacterium]|nr:four helix bundle protein [Halobacteriovoraceae bacterium]
MEKFETLELAIDFAKLVRKQRGLDLYSRDQLTRAAMSVALNLSEGAGRFTKNEKRRFYRISYGSLRECQTLLKILDKENTNVYQLSNKVGGSLWNLLKSLN